MAQWTIKHPDGTQSVVGGIVGALVPFAGATPPAHTLLCNGAAVSRETYAELFAAIGTTYGSGDDSTTFNLPNYSGGQFLRGTGGNAAALGTAQGDAIRNITGTICAIYWGAWVTNTGALTMSEYGTTPAKVGIAGGDAGGNVKINFDASKVVPTAGENRPINLAATFCIVYE